jgi:uncharacterized membrane protein YecN with MAPEG domain
MYQLRGAILSLPILYNKPERKRELVAFLQKQLETYLDRSDKLDAKASALFNTVNAVVGLAFALIVIAGDDINIAFFVLLLAALVIYLLHTWLVIRTQKPRDFGVVPYARDDGDDTFVPFMVKYVAPDDDEYLDRLIVDYIGKRDEDGNLLPGVLQTAQQALAVKKRTYDWASYLVPILIVLLIAMAFTTLA